MKRTLACPLSTSIYCHFSCCFTNNRNIASCELRHYRYFWLDSSPHVWVTPMLHPHYAHWLEVAPMLRHWLEDRHVEIQWSPTTKQELGTAEPWYGEKLSSVRLSIDDHLFCREKALLLGSNIMVNSIRSLLACLIYQRDAATLSHINNPWLLHISHQLENNKNCRLVWSNAKVASSTTTAAEHHHPALTRPVGAT